MSKVEEETKEEERKKASELIDVLPFVSSLYQAEGNLALGLCKHLWHDANLWSILIEAKHSPKNKDGSTPALVATRLVLASRKGRLDVVQRLLELGAKIEAKDEKFGKTSLSWASGCGHLDVVMLLLDRHADINTLSKGKSSPLYRCIKCSFGRFSCAACSRCSRAHGICH
jgi:ankyrin repeat protein